MAGSFPTKRKSKRLGRPPRRPGKTYALRDVPVGDYKAFRAMCRRLNVTMRSELISMIRQRARSQEISR